MEQAKHLTLDFCGVDWSKLPTSNPKYQKYQWTGIPPHKNFITRIPTVAVVGDFMTDIYHMVTVKAEKSPEADIPVYNYITTIKLPGGAGNVLRNLNTLGIGIIKIGQDMPVKNRLMQGNTQVARWDENDFSHPLDPDITSIMIRGADAVVVADYRKGAITQEIKEVLNKFDGPLFVDNKTGPYEWREENIIFFPNRLEYNEHRVKYKFANKVVLKDGRYGISETDRCGMYNIRRYPAFTDKVVSVCGAGDTVIAAYTCAYLRNFPDPLLYANAAAAVVVQKPFTATATHKEIVDMMKQNRFEVKDYV